MKYYAVYFGSILAIDYRAKGPHKYYAIYPDMAHATEYAKDMNENTNGGYVVCEVELRSPKTSRVKK